MIKQCQWLPINQNFMTIKMDFMFFVGKWIKVFVVEIWEIGNDDKNTKLSLPNYN